MLSPPPKCIFDAQAFDAQAFEALGLENARLRDENARLRSAYEDRQKLNLLRLKSKGSVFLSACGARLNSFPTEVGGFKPIGGKSMLS